MSDEHYEYHDVEGGVGIKSWTRGVEIEKQALKQLQNVAKIPFVFKHVAVMPDVHWGIGATVGSVIATKGAIIPAAVGVDIGCGMVAVKTTLRPGQLPVDLHAMRTAIESAVPHGRTDNGGRNDRGAWGNVPDANAQALEPFAERLDAIGEKHPRLKTGPGSNVHRQLATLGTGNHFIEVCTGDDDAVWIMLHSGSRGIGNRIGTYFIEQAQKQAERYGYASYLPDKDLAWFNDGTELFGDYIRALTWAQEYAALNRRLMLANVVEAIRPYAPPFELAEAAINCHHNYAARENHFGSNVWVTRKGAVRARTDDLGIIPGSMGTRSYIVRGKGNEDSFTSCSHGAGRAMSRAEAKRRFTLADHLEAVEGVECRHDADVIDETPMAYKPIDAVIEAERDLVEVVAIIKQVLCVKG